MALDSGNPCRNDGSHAIKELLTGQNADVINHHPTILHASAEIG